MPRPVFKDVNSSLQNWDAANRDNWANVSSRPAALFRIPNGQAGPAGTYPASQYEQCFASYDTNGSGLYVPVWSNGTNWIDLRNGNTVA